MIDPIFVPVGNARNAADPAGLYHDAMAAERTSAGIVRAGTAGSFTYTVTGPSGITPPGATSLANRPITHVNWFDAARFAN